MELKFNNFRELVDFLDEIGYTLTTKEKKEEAMDKQLKITEKDLKDFWKENPWNPYNPYAPTYPNYPIVTFDAMFDDNLSDKFGKC